MKENGMILKNDMVLVLINGMMVVFILDILKIMLPVDMEN